MPSNTKSIKLLSLHLTYTLLALSSSTLTTLTKDDFFKFGTQSSSRSSSLGSKHSLLFSWVASGIQCVKRHHKWDRGWSYIEWRSPHSRWKPIAEISGTSEELMGRCRLNRSLCVQIVAIGTLTQCASLRHYTGACSDEASIKPVLEGVFCSIETSSLINSMLNAPMVSIITIG